MLTTPVFAPWRPLWDAELAELTAKLDLLALARSKGRATVPLVAPALIEFVGYDHVQDVLWSDVPQRDGRTMRVLRKLRPLIDAAVWQRWLLLESALEEASISGSLHLAALVLRTQIEELDKLCALTPVLDLNSVVDGQTFEDAVRTLATFVLPRVTPKTAQELVDPAPDAPGTDQRSPGLHAVYSALGDYVHPNYGSHVLSLRPHSIEGGRVIVEAFADVYETFLDLPWARVEADQSRIEIHRDRRPQVQVLLEQTIPQLSSCVRGPKADAFDVIAIPALRSFLGAENEWNNAARFLLRDANVEAEDCIPADQRRDEPMADLRVGAVLALVATGQTPDTMPEQFSDVGRRLAYAQLVNMEAKLSSDARSLKAGEGYDETRLPLLRSALVFSVNLIEYQLNRLASQCARLINSGNVLAAALVVRSMLEHHGVAIELGQKLEGFLDKTEKAYPQKERMLEPLRAAERQIARILAGSPGTAEGHAEWYSLWQGDVSIYNVMGPIKLLDARQPGYLRTYGWLSHIIHGSICTGGDLIVAGDDAVRRRVLAQVTLILGGLLDIRIFLDRQAWSGIAGVKLNALARSPDGDLNGTVGRMRLLKGQKLKQGRDIRGNGTQDRPYVFRDGLIYHEAFYAWLEQVGIIGGTRRSQPTTDGVLDVVLTADGKTIYFLNSNPFGESPDERSARGDLFDERIARGLTVPEWEQNARPNRHGA